jgi:hypothetical protein
MWVWVWKWGDSQTIASFSQEKWWIWSINFAWNYPIWGDPKIMICPYFLQKDQKHGVNSPFMDTWTLGATLKQFTSRNTSRLPGTPRTSGHRYIIEEGGKFSFFLFARGIEKNNSFSILLGLWRESKSKCHAWDMHQLAPTGSRKMDDIETQDAKQYWKRTLYIYPLVMSK